MSRFGDFPYTGQDGRPGRGRFLRLPWFHFTPEGGKNGVAWGCDSVCKWFGDNGLQNIFCLSDSGSPTRRAGDCRPFSSGGPWLAGQPSGPVRTVGKLELHRVIERELGDPAPAAKISSGAPR